MPLTREEPSSFGRFTFDAKREELSDGDGPVIRLTDRERQLFVPVRRQPRRHLVSREALAGEPGDEIGERTIDVQINRLRRKIEDDPDQSHAHLQTVRGVGYRLRIA